jgi:dihydropteroate synthase
MGILNVTPDSFSDGGVLTSVEEVVAAGRRMRDAGAAVLDIGGESTRPGASEVTLDEELRRVIPAVRALVERVGLPVSVDTRKSGVFREAWAAGASMLNDVSGLWRDPEMAPEAAATDAAVIVMHLRGTPATMDLLARYQDTVAEVVRELEDGVRHAQERGIPRERLWIDPGVGFAKTPAQSWEVIRAIDRFVASGLPVCVGPSRKRFLAAATGRETPADRDAATAALVSHLARAGVAMVRVHAVAPAVDAVAIARAVSEPVPAAADRGAAP